MGWEAELTMSLINFPNVKGSNLLRQQLTLPKDFQGKLNLVFIAFEQWQQNEVDSWIPLAEELEAQVSGLVYYELPTIQSRNNVYQWFINEGMRAGIPNPKTREHTITLYLNKITFRKALGFPDEDHIYILVIDGQGNVLFQLRGPHTPLSETYLRDFLLKQAENPDS
jgi:hypothetical protein